MTNCIDNEKLANYVGYSAYQFQKLFKILTGQSLHQYIRCRRLTRAANDLISTEEKVIDIALKYCYESPEAFSRAFLQQHGVTPSKARVEKQNLKYYPKITIRLTIQGVKELDYTIRTLESFDVYGFEGVLDTADEPCDDITRFWQSSIANGEVDQLAKTCQSVPYNDLLAVNGISNYINGEKSSFHYMLFAFRNIESEISGYKVISVPASTWAIFRSADYCESEVTVNMQKLNEQVYKEWLPTSSYNLLEGYEMELYYMSNDTGTCYCETWIRVEKDY